jgi:cytoskeleton-associated protein 5
MNPLLICLQDRSSNVRNAAEEIIKNSLSFISINNYYKKIEDFKPAIAKTLKQILDKIKAEVPQESNNNNTETDNQTPSQPQQQVTTESNNSNINNNKSTENKNDSSTKIIQKEKLNSKKNMPKITSKKALPITDTSSATEPGIDDSEKNDTSNNNTIEDQMSNFSTVSNFSKTTRKNEKELKSKKSAANLKKSKPKRKMSEDDLVNPLGTAMNKQMPVTSVAHLASNSTILKKNERKSFLKTTSHPIKTPSVFLMNVKVIPNKAKRFEKDKKTKFSIETVNKDYFNKLKDQCKGLFVEEFSKKIFSDDFRKQAEAFKEMKSQIDKKINVPIYFDNLDLILKIIGIKILNNLNPTLMKNLFEFLDSLYLILNENKYKLNETESNIIINILIDKFSLNNNTLKEHLISILNKFIELLDANKIMATVINVALNKNNKIKTDILDITINLVSEDKLNIANRTYAKLLCKFLPLYDNTIRTKTLNLFQEIFSNVGEELWSMIEISDKDREFLEENLFLDDDEEEEEEEDENNEGTENILNDNQINNNNDNNKIINTNNDNNEITNTNDTQVQNNNNLLTNPNGPLTKEDLLDALNNLSSNDLTEKLNNIIIIHEIICGKFEQNKECLISNVDKIISTFKNISHQLFFVKDLKTIPIKFAKYVSIVLCKLTSNKELISNLSYRVLLDLSRELLGYLLINGLDKIGENQEGNIIFKSINSTMLRVLENCDTTSVISALLELIKEFHEKEDKNLISLSIKCLLKTTQNLSEKIDNIKIDKILLQIHLLLLDLQKKDSGMTSENHISHIIIKSVRNIVEEFVKLKKEKILEDYSKSVKNHQLNDKFLLKWIKASLSNM